MKFSACSFFCYLNNQYMYLSSNSFVWSASLFHIHFHSEYSLKNYAGNQILHRICICLFSHSNWNCQIASNSPAKLRGFFFLNLPRSKKTPSCLSCWTPKTRLQNGWDRFQLPHFLQQALNKERQVYFKNNFLEKQTVTKAELITDAQFPPKTRFCHILQ